MSEGRILLRHYLALAVLLSVTAFAAREAFLFLRAQTTLGHNIWSTRRASEMIKAAEKLDSAHAGRRVLFLGSSDTVLGVRARDVEDALNAKSPGWQVLNFAFLGLDGRAMRLLIDRLSETPALNSGSIHSVFIGFQPTFYTRRFREMRRRGSGAFAFERELYSPAMMWNQAKADPRSALQVWSTVYLFDGISPGEARRNLGRLVERGEGRGERGMDRVWEFDGPDLKGFDWETRGHFYFDAPGADPRSARAAAEFVRYRDIWRQRVARAYDGLALNMDEGLLADLAANIERLKGVAKHVVLFQPSPCAELGVTEDGRARAREALMRLGRETGAVTVELGGFTCADYFDMLHLNREGQNKLTPLLVKEIENLP